MRFLIKPLLSTANKIHILLFEFTKKKLPLFAFYIFTYPRSKFLYFNDEKKLEKGINISNSSKQSIIHFTTHKCASIYVSRIIKKLAQNEGMTNIDFSSYFSVVDQTKYDQLYLESFLSRAFLTKGYHYCAYRGYFKIPNITDFKVILMLRDPRDVLTSAYFSAKFSHPNINSDIIKRRSRMQKNEQSIDDFVIAQHYALKKTYETYIENLIPLENVLFLKYEEMISDFTKWLSKIFLFAEIKNELLQDEIISNHSIPAKEDILIHKRKVTPGDYKEKLSQKTIDNLNESFKDILLKLDYSVN